MEKMENIFKSYKQRLISIDSRNSSFFLSRLRAKRHIDLVKSLAQFIEKDVLLEKLLNSKTINIVIDDDKSNIQDINKLKKVLNEIINVGKTIERDTGKDDVYLGFPFVEGKFGNGKNFRGPLILHKIELKTTKTGFKISFLKEHKLINPVFILSYFSDFNKTPKNMMFEIPEEEEYLKYTSNFLNLNDILINQEKQDLEEIQSITKKDYEEKQNYLPMKFEIKYYSIFGVFPISSENIYNDIDFLSKSDDVSEVLETLLISGKEYDQDEVNEMSEELDIKYISPLDWSQRVVIKDALEENIVIEGPPGTGKSQTIVNLLVNALIEDKKILVVSEKVAAIDVIYNRLGSLKDNALLIKNHIRDRDFFYKQLEDSKDLILNHKEKPLYNAMNDRVIDRYLLSLKNINNKNFYKSLTYEDVLRVAKNRRIRKIKKTAAINDFITYINTNQKNLIKTLNKLLSDDVIKARKDFQRRLNNLNVFKNLSNAEITHFMSQKDYPINLQKYNYYLYRLNRNIKTYNDFGLFVFDVKTRFTKYEDFSNFVDSLYLKSITYYSDLLELNKPIYNELISLNHIKLAVRWNTLKDKQKYREIKRALKPKRRKCFILNLFNLFKPRRRDILAYKDYLDIYLTQFNMEVLKRIAENLNETEFLILKEYTNRDLHHKDYLLQIILTSNIVNFKDDNFKRINNYFLKGLPKINKGSFNEIRKFDQSELRLIDEFTRSNLNKENFIEAFLHLYIPTERLEESLYIYEYFKTNEKYYGNVKSAFNEKYFESSRYVNNYVKTQIINKFKKDKELYNEYEGLVSQSYIKTPRSIKNLFERYFKAIITAYPIILTTPDVVSSILEMKKEIFDYVIFDEASQMFIERAIPSIYRGKRIVVAGDSKQLKPSSVFTSRITEFEDYDDDLLSNREIEALDKESLLEMVKQKYKSKMLQFHYRSEKEELIEFSSAAFYGRKLFFATKLSDFKDKRPIEVIDVENGLWTEKNTNEQEAEAVLNLLTSLIEERKNNETIGVITFNAPQMQLITEKLEQSNNPKLLRELDRTNIKTGNDESLFVKNIENVQGDERDIIIFSVAYAKNKEGIIRSQFGLLNQSGGENRLNVAITRAKTKIYLVKSIKSYELSVNVNNPGPALFKRYLEFAEYVNDGLTENKNALLDVLSNNKQNDLNIKEKMTHEFKHEVYDELEKIIPEHMRLTKDFNVGGFVIDIAVYDTLKEEFVYGFECDGYRWEITKDENERTFYLQQYLETRGWNIKRVIATNWFFHKGDEIKKLKKLFDKALR